MARVTHLVTLLMMMVVVGLASGGERPCSDPSEIECSSDVGRCIPYRYLCDDDPDCGSGGEDEDGDLCEVWKNNECGRGQIKCRSNGACIAIQDYCAEDSNCDDDMLDRRVCQMIQDGRVKPLSEIKLRIAGNLASDLQKSETLASEFVLLLNNTIQHPSCPTMFTLVEDQCVAIFFVGSVSWGEAQAFCQVLGGDLITFRDVTHFTSIVSHLREAQLTVDFWVGGSLANETEGWRWLDDTQVDAGTPFWAVRHDSECQPRNVTFPELNQTREANDGECYNYIQAPYHPPRGRCLSLPYQHYYYMADENCLEKKSPLCVLPESGQQFEIRN